MKKMLVLLTGLLFGLMSTSLAVSDDTPGYRVNSLKLTVMWPGNSVVDIDIFGKLPDGNIISFKNHETEKAFLLEDSSPAANRLELLHLPPVYTESIMVNELEEGEYQINTGSTLYLFNRLENESDTFKSFPVKVTLVVSGSFKSGRMGKILLTTSVILNSKREEKVLAKFRLVKTPFLAGYGFYIDPKSANQEGDRLIYAQAPRNDIWVAD